MTIKKLLFPVLIAISATTSLPSFAEDKTPGAGPNPYSDCGIGAALFTETKWAAVTSNVIWDVGITAITSATASPQTCSGKKVATAMFIGKTYANLSEETAAGQGEHLTAALNLFGCGETQHTAAITQVRREMADVVSAPNYASQTAVEKASAYYSTMERAVSQNCAA